MVCLGAGCPPSLPNATRTPHCPSKRFVLGLRVQGHMSGGWGEPSEVVSVDSGLEARDSDPPGACFNVDICIHNFFLWIFFLFVILLSICYHLLVLSTNAFSQLQGIVLKVESVQSSDNLGMGLPSRFTVFFLSLQLVQFYTADYTFPIRPLLYMIYRMIRRSFTNTTTM